MRESRAKKEPTKETKRVHETEIQELLYLPTRLQITSQASRTAGEAGFPPAEGHLQGPDENGFKGLPCIRAAKTKRGEGETPGPPQGGHHKGRFALPRGSAALRVRRSSKQPPVNDQGANQQTPKGGRIGPQRSGTPDARRASPSTQGLTQLPAYQVGMVCTPVSSSRVHR